MNSRVKHLFCVFVIFLFQSCDNKKEVIEIQVNKAATNSAEYSFKTIEEALQAAKKIRENDNESPLVINLTNENYYLKAPILITPELNGLHIKSDGNVTIKGSQKLDLAWTKKDENLWQAKLPDSIEFDQLFVNNKKQNLARYPNYNEDGGHWQGHAADAISPERIKTWSNPVGAIFHVMHTGEWGGFHFEVSGVDENGEAILKGGHQNNRKSAGIHENYRMVENVYEELDSTGEWFFNRSNRILYYWPLEEENIAESVFEGVRLKNLITVKGSEENPVTNIVIEGINFEHAQRTINEKYEPLLRSDWTIYRGGAVLIEGSEQVEIKDCTFTNLGGNAIFVSNYNRNATIVGNHIYNCGASGVSFVGSPSAVRSPSFQYREFVAFSKLDTIKGPLNNKYPSKCFVDNNLIYRIGRLEKQTAGVEISMAMDITVSNNSVYEVPRAGINISEGTWGGHVIEYNDVFKTVLESGDHGAFNSWGRDRFWHPDRPTMDSLAMENPTMPLWDAVHTTIIRNNRFKCEHGWDIDLDDGSSNYKIYNNVCLNGGLKLREGFYRTVENNIMINNGFHPHVWFKNSGDIFRRNIVMTDHKDIRLHAWGKEVDYNLFPDAESLTEAHENGTDKHSVYGNPNFIDPLNGDYTVAEDSPAYTIGFKNFSMDSFGVKKPSLRKLSKQPLLPKLWSLSDEKVGGNKTVNWLGGNFKNIESLADRSAFGLSKTSGVLLTEIDEKSILSYSEMELGDVIISAEENEVETIYDLLKVVQEHQWKGVVNITIFRNQKSTVVKVKTKK
ncbi:right-handed parallel beta-helix repeat-containing protein [Aurantibacter sp.]|uniref:right-handed parallel beta-helix repeat-containing protein n=1 Tax=Aurantibacter sp. TaxID=2807103 RepID=UPI003265EEB4